MKKKFRSHLICTCLLFFLFTASFLLGTAAQTDNFDPNIKYSVELLKTDFSILRQALEQGHGGIYRYSTKQEMDARFNGVLQKLNQPLSEIEFYRLLLPLIASINDGHTRINVSPTYRSYISRQSILFPFKLKFVHGKPYLLRNYSEDPDIPIGGEVFSINGRSAKKIISALLEVIPSDAHVNTSKYRKLESTNFFGDLYNILFGLTQTYTIEYFDPKQENKQKITVPGRTGNEINRVLRERYPAASTNNPPISFEYREGIPILTIRTFGNSVYARAKINYQDFLENVFSELKEKKVSHLVIDLRNNSGGSDLYGKLLAAYLIDEPFLYYQYLEVKNIEFPFLEYSNLPPSRRKMPESGFRKNERGWYDSLGHPNLGDQKPLDPNFKGEVYILINGSSFSATGECTSIIHFHKKAIFVGEECGAGYYGNTSGFMPMVTLPNTKIRINIPLVRYTMAVSDYPKDRGLIPDFAVEPTIGDVLNGRDTELEFLLDKIKQ